MNCDKSFKIFLIVAIFIIAISMLFGGIGSVFEIEYFQKTHPYIFFIGFGNLSILILNKYLTSFINEKLKISPKLQLIYIITVLTAVFFILFSHPFPVFKIISGSILFILITYHLFYIFKTISIKEILKSISLKYYIADAVFLLNAAMGLFALGIKETFDNPWFIPFFVNKSAYFLGSSFPLSISTMGFLYTYVISKTKKADLVKLFFNLWFYTFVFGVLIFYFVILINNYLGMMLMSNSLIFGVIIILTLFIKSFYNFYKNNIFNTGLIYLLIGIVLLISAGVFGVLNIYYLQPWIASGNPLTAKFPLPELKMFNYHLHTHNALMGWISFSFLGMIHLVSPIILNKDIDKRDEILNYKTNLNTKKSFIQIIILLISTVVIFFTFYFENKVITSIATLILVISYVFILKTCLKIKKC